MIDRRIGTRTHFVRIRHRSPPWWIGVVVLALLLASLGCGICPGIPGEPTATSSPSLSPSPSPSPPPVAPLSPVPTPTPRPTPVSEIPVELVPYTNSVVGFSMHYPADWLYQTEPGSVSFAEPTEGLASFDPAEGPMFSVGMVSREEVDLEFGILATPADMLESLLEELRQEQRAEIGGIEEWVFGETPGAGVEVSWADTWTDALVHGYVVTALGDGVAGVGFGGAPEADWPSYDPVFRRMLDSLEFFPPEVPEPVERGTIQPGEAIRGTLPLGGTDVWYFEVEEGQYVTIEADAADPDALDLYLELYTEDGLLIAEDDDGGDGVNARIADSPVLASATLVVHVLTYSGEGDYSLGLGVSDEPTTGGVVAYGETVQKSLEEGMGHGWFFTGSEGDVVTVAMRALDTDLDCYLELYGPDGQLLTEDDDSGQDLDALIEYYELPADGAYRVVALGAVMGVGGAYELSLEQTEMVTQGVLTYGDTVMADLERDTRHHWLFEGVEGDVVTISMIALEGDMDTYLELFAPNGVRVRTDDDSSGDSDAEISEFDLPLSGTYRVIARGYSDDDVGKYKLTLIGP
jgi:hypothetical protein